MNTTADAIIHDAAADDDDDPMEDMSEVGGLDAPIVYKPRQRTQSAKKYDIPFDEPDAPFDEPFDMPAAAPSPRRAHFDMVSPLPPQIQGEHTDQPSTELGASEPLYGRVKSLKSIDFDTSRTRTYNSEMTGQTKKAANLASGSNGNGPSAAGSKLDDTLTIESRSLEDNGSSVSSPIVYSSFHSEDAKGKVSSSSGNRKDGHGSGHGAGGSTHHGNQPPSETTKLRDRLPQLPATPPRKESSRANGENRRSSSQKNRASNHNDTGRRGSNNKYYSKRAYSSSAEDETSYEDEEETTETVETNDWNGGEDDAMDDDVSALSGIGNDSIESKKKRRGRMGRGGRRRESEKQEERHGSRSRDDKRHDRSSRNRRSEKSRSEPRGKDAHQSRKGSNNDKQRTANEWTQQELDSFIAQNDWGSVSKYINEMRTSTQGNNNHRPRSFDHKNDGQPSLREIQDQIKYNRSLEQDSLPKPRFGARSQIQHDVLSQDREEEEESGGVESESVWQSLSSTSYDESSAGASSGQYYRRQQQQQQQQRQQGRESRRRRSSPREMIM